MNIKYRKKEIIIFVTTLLGGLFLGYFLFHNPDPHDHQVKIHQSEKAAEVWTCSMHPQIRSQEPGLCPICAMDLVQVESHSSTNEQASGEISLSESAIKLADIQTTAVQTGTPEKIVYLNGKVMPDERNFAEITARFGGRIEELFINFTGQQVKTGQILGKIYSPDLINTQKELIEAYKYKGSNPAFYQSVKTKLKYWNISDQQIASIEKTAVPEEFFTINSPINGTVTARNVVSGEYVKEGSGLFTIINLNKLWILLDAYEKDLPWIKTGDEVSYSIDALPGATFRGKVNYIDPVIDPVSRTAKIRVEAKNQDLKLKPEMFVTGFIKSNMNNLQNAILIPKSAVLWTGKRSIVYVKQMDRPEPAFLMREIKLGPDAGDKYVVSEGLDDGEVIAMNGVFKIDAAAQLAGLPSMMNPQGGAVSHSNHMHSSESHKAKNADPSSLTSITFKVFGNCSMCRDRIEEAAGSTPGVHAARWNQETKMIEVEYEPERINIENIHQAIAAAGHDTEVEKAPDEVYKKLPPCCSYRD